ncbi:MAG: nitroreductase family protein [Candidatus Kariarchaeaceae archaeon]|jgi:nitroreductase
MNSEELLEIIKSRRSIRDYVPKIMSVEMVNKLIEAAQWAPTAGNLQPLELIVVKNEDTKMTLVSAAGGQEFLSDCSVVFVMGANIPRTSSKYKDRGEKLYCLQDVAAATQNVLLLAHSMGVGSCWVGAFDEKEVSKVCNLPNHIRPIVMIALGYMDTKIKPVIRPRREKKDFVHLESFGKK